MTNELIWFLTLAQADGAPQPPSSGLSMLVLLLLFGGLMILMIGPQRKQRREHQKMISELKSGDEIVTSGGIYGVITNVKDDRFVVKVADNTRLEVGKSFIQTRVSGQPRS